MSYQVLTGGGGLAGWKFLNRTSEKQRELVARDARVVAATVNFHHKIASITSAEDLISDFRLMNVALQAFGLEGDIGNKAYIRKVLESDLSDERSLANRLSNKNYKQLAGAFNFGEPGAVQTTSAEFADMITSRYIQREFEARVGKGDRNLRLGLSAQHELGALAKKPSSNTTKWYEILGNTPLRTVFEGAFGFTSAYRKLPIDRQLSEFRDAAKKIFGTDDIQNIAAPESREKLIQRFLVRSGVQVDSASNRYSAALTLLSGL